MVTSGARSCGKVLHGPRSSEGAMAGRAQASGAVSRRLVSIASAGRRLLGAAEKLARHARRSLRCRTGPGTDPSPGLSALASRQLLSAGWPDLACVRRATSARRGRAFREAPHGRFLGSPLHRPRSPTAPAAGPSPLPSPLADAPSSAPTYSRHSRQAQSGRCHQQGSGSLGLGDAAQQIAAGALPEADLVKEELRLTADDLPDPGATLGGAQLEARVGATRRRRCRPPNDAAADVRHERLSFTAGPALEGAPRARSESRQSPL